MISIPDGKLEEPFSTRVVKTLRKARGRGVDVLMKCFNWKDLSDDWQGFGWQSDDAAFPLVVIDGTVCWYDVLPARGEFASKDGVIAPAAVQVPLRIEGRATVPMIWSLTGLDNRSTSEGKQALRERRGTTPDDKDGTAAYGLAKYVKEHKKCSRCKAPMKLMTGRNSGKPYLKCTSCDNRELLLIDDVRHYISVSRVRCPQCHRGITVKLTRFGLWIKCDGDHTLKADQI